MARKKYDQSLYETRIRPLLDAKEGTNAEKERIMRLPGKIISNWNNAGYGSWANYLYELAVFLGVSVEYLAGETDDPTPIRRQTEPGEDRAKTLVSLFEKLTPEDQKFFEDMMQLRLDQKSKQ